MPRYHKSNEMALCHQFLEAAIEWDGVVVYSSFSFYKTVPQFWKSCALTQALYEERFSVEVRLHFWETSVFHHNPPPLPSSPVEFNPCCPCSYLINIQFSYASLSSNFTVGRNLNGYIF